jgi:hypothetical protein
VASIAFILVQRPSWENPDVTITPVIRILVPIISLVRRSGVQGGFQPHEKEEAASYAFVGLPLPAGQRQPVLRQENKARLVQGNSSPVTLSCSPRRSSNRMRRISSRLDAHVQLPDAGNDRSLQPRQSAVCRLFDTQHVQMLSGTFVQED